MAFWPLGIIFGLKCKMDCSEPARAIEKFKQDVVTILPPSNGPDRNSMKLVSVTGLTFEFVCRIIWTCYFKPWREYFHYYSFGPTKFI